MKKQYYCLIFSILLVCMLPYNILAQKTGQAKIDSILARLPAMKPDTSRCGAANMLANEYRVINNVEKAIEFSQQALTLATALHYKLGLIQAEGNLGIGLYLQRKYTDAMLHLNKGIALAAGMNQFFFLNLFYLRIGRCYFYSKDNEKAISCHTKGLSYFEQIGNKKYQQFAHFYFAEVYAANKSTFSKAIENYQKVLQLGKTVNASLYGSVLTILGPMYSKMNDYDNATAYYTRVIEEQDNGVTESDKDFALYNLGATAMRQGDKAKAKPYFEKVLKNGKTVSPKMYGLALLNKAFSFPEQGNTKEQLKDAQEALVIARELKDNEMLSMSLQGLGTAYSNLKDRDNALKFYNEGLDVAVSSADIVRESDILLLLGFEYAKQAKYTDAITAYQKALTIGQKTGDAIANMSNTMAISSLFYKMDDKKQTELYLRKALYWLDKTNNKNLIVLRYGIEGGLAEGDNDDVKALDYFQKGLSLASASNNNNSDQQLNFLESIVQIYLRQKNYLKAYEYTKQYEKAIANAKVNTDYNKILLQLSVALITRDASEAELAKMGIKPHDRYKKALTALKAEIDFAKENKDIFIEQKIQYELGVTYEKMHDYKNAYEARGKYADMRDSTFELNNQNNLKSAAADYDFNRKEDSLKYQQSLTSQQLTQQQQALTVSQQQLSLANTQKDIERLNYQKSQVSLQSEQNRRRANEQALLVANKEQALEKLNVVKSQSDFKAEQNLRKANQQQLIASKNRSALADKTVELQKTEIKAKRNQSYYFIGGIAALVLLSFFIASNYNNQRKSNRLLTTANTQISAEKQRSDALLLNILPADVAEELKEKGSANARLFDEVTVLFTDFVNFTTISELLSPQQLVDELHTCFKAFDDIMAAHHIEKIKTIGDAYLAVAGLPNADAEHAANAVAAALEIRQFISDRKNLLGDKTFDIRIGIHSGSVVAGIVGVKKFAYDIWGDTVNTAARMEQNSEPGKINVSEKTYELVKDQFAFTYRGEIEAKNKGKLKMYFAEGLDKVVTEKS